MTTFNLTYPAGLSAALMDALYDLPISPNPWEAVGTAVGESGEAVLMRVRGFLRDGFIRDIGPVLNPRSLGYQTTLAAGFVAADRLDSVAAIVSAHPGVSHNYLRECDQFNLWFTLSIPGGAEELTRELTTLSDQTGVAFRQFDTVQMYKISFRLNGKPPAKASHSSIRFADIDSKGQTALAEAIEFLQQGLSLVDRPFLAMAKSAGTMTETELLRRSEQLRQTGLMRRLGVIWRHRELGLRENVLCVWRMPETRMAEFANRVKTIPNITHCYRRQTYADWPWSIYTMIHGNDSEQCRAGIEELKRAVPEAEYLPLRTLKEYKKARVIYHVS
jgi:DNA-binding Lrp family transcriptional regulator